MVIMGSMSVCGLVGFFGAMAVVLGIAAELTHVKANKAMEDCLKEKPDSSSLVLGMLAAISLFIAEALLTACGCCVSANASATHSLGGGEEQSRRIRRRSKALLCLLLSWICFGNAFFLLVEAALLNGKQSRSSKEGTITCFIVKPRVFAAGAALSLLTTLFGIVYYIILTSSSAASVQIHPLCEPHQNHSVDVDLHTASPILSVAANALPPPAKELV